MNKKELEEAYQELLIEQKQVEVDLHRELCKRHGPLFVDETLQLQ
jgi:hypothetical protein